MKHIFILEIKKALNSRKNQFLVMIYLLLLILFAASNMENFKDVREKEIDRIEHIVKATNNRAILITEMLGFDKYANIQEENPAEYRSMMDEYDYVMKFVQNYTALSEAISRNDRKSELEIYSRAAHDLYIGTTLAHERYGRLINTFDGQVNFEEWEEFDRVRAEFIQQLVDNDIHYIYKNEMTGFNFIYQVMLQFLPFIILLLAFISVCDVFTSDNDAGSYKFLLLQPYSRLKIYTAKLMSAVLISSAQIFVPIILVFAIMSAINGLGSPEYPVLFQTEAYTSFTPTPNQLYVNLKRGFSFFDTRFFCMRAFTYNGYAYVLENASMGISEYSPWNYYYSAFLPHESLGFKGMLECILMAMPIYIALILFAASVSALIGVVSQNGSITLVCGAVIGAAAVFFQDPIRDMEFIRRLNPFIYANPVNILNGLGSTTALTGMIVLSVISAVFFIIGVIIFNRKDIRC